MLTYQIRPRIFRHEPGTVLEFPAECEMRFHLLPGQAFGATSDGGRTLVRGASARVLFNANSGLHTVESDQPLSPLHVTINEPLRTVRLTGTTLRIAERFESLTDLELTLQSIYFGLPTLLNIPFADPPYVERVEASVGNCVVRWELADFKLQMFTTSQEHQEEMFAKAWERMGLLGEPGNRRLIAALHYFHVACRLARSGYTAGEFMAEVLLNLSKSLEVLFPPSGDGKSRDAARAGLRKLGFEDKEIERDFVPAMSLRNEIDVGHVELGLFSREQLKTIHTYTDRAEEAFRKMFDRVLTRLESGDFKVNTYELGSPSAKAVAVIERIKVALADH